MDEILLPTDLLAIFGITIGWKNLNFISRLKNNRKEICNLQINRSIKEYTSNQQ
jgi:hypothetical protein